MWKERWNINKSRTDFNAKLHNFCKEKNIGFIDNGNFNENDLRIQKLHLNRKGNSASATNLLNVLENHWGEVSESDLFLKECISDSSETGSAKMHHVLKCDKKEFAHINIDSIKTNLIC